MVFESLVTDVLNRFIGEYVENLDSSQLKIGIWGGKLLFILYFNYKIVQMQYFNEKNMKSFFVYYTYLNSKF